MNNNLPNREQREECVPDTSLPSIINQIKNTVLSPQSFQQIDRSIDNVNILVHEFHLLLVNSYDVLGEHIVSSWALAFYSNLEAMLSEIRCVQEKTYAQMLQMRRQ